MSESGAGRADAVDRSCGGPFYVGQIAKMLGITPSALRAWEKHGLLTPDRTTSGYRTYSMADFERAREVKKLTDSGANLASVKMLLDSREETSPTDAGPTNLTKPTGHIGERVRRLRLQQAISIRQLAAQIGMSASYISSIERSGATPTLASVQRLAAALGSTVQDILAPNDPHPHPSPVTRSNERKILETGPRGNLIEDLSMDSGGLLESLAMTIEPGAGSEGPVEHPGEEFVYILSGHLQVTLDGMNVYELSPDDSMSFSSTRLHHWINYGSEPVRLLWINTPRTF